MSGVPCSRRVSMPNEPMQLLGNASYEAQAALTCQVPFLDVGRCNARRCIGHSGKVSRARHHHGHLRRLSRGRSSLRKSQWDECRRPVRRLLIARTLGKRFANPILDDLSDDQPPIPRLPDPLHRDPQHFQNVSNRLTTILPKSYRVFLVAATEIEADEQPVGVAQLVDICSDYL